MADLTLKRGDLSPVLRAQLTDNGTPVEFGDGDTAAIVLRRIRSAEAPVLNGVDATIIDPDTIEGELGWVEYEWAEGDTDTAGGFVAEFTCVISGKQATFPNDRSITVNIIDDLEVESEEES